MFHERGLCWRACLLIGATAWHGGLEWVLDQMLRVVVSATVVSPKAKPQVEDGKLEHFQIGKPSSTEERLGRGPSLSI